MPERSETKPVVGSDGMTRDYGGGLIRNTELPKYSPNGLPKVEHDLTDAEKAIIYADRVPTPK
jgi:hypothetical protein